MTYRVEYSTRALSRLAEIEEYLSARSPKGSANVLADIDATVGLIALWPLIGVEIPDRPVRKKVTQKYRYSVIYRFDGECIRIIEIFHPRQKTPYDPT